MDQLQQARECITEIDREMALLFERRMEAAAQVAAYKKEHGLPVLDKNRERQVIENGSARIQNDALRGDYVQFLEHMMALSRRYQHRLLEGMRIAYCGTEGAFAHIAAGEIFPGSQRVGCGSFGEAYGAAEQGDCDCAVLPLENSLAGEVGQVTDLLYHGSLFIDGVYELPVRHHLLALPGAEPAAIREAVSHPQALEQCSGFLKRQGLQTRAFANTALAAKFVAESGDRTLAAIASEQTAKRLGLTVLERDIQDSGSNTTRFGVFSRAPRQKAGDHFILLFTTENEAGALARALDVIGSHGFNLRTLRSRPRRDGLWNYYFYAEAKGDCRSDEAKALLEALQDCCRDARIAGSFTADCRIGEGEAL